MMCHTYRENNQLRGAVARNDPAGSSRGRNEDYRRPGLTRQVRSTYLLSYIIPLGWLGSRVVSVLDSGAEGPGFKSQPRRCRVTALGKLFTPIVLLFTKQQNW